LAHHAPGVVPGAWCKPRRATHAANCAFQRIFQSDEHLINFARFEKSSLFFEKSGGFSRVK